MRLSLILPAKNEAAALAPLLTRLRERFSEAELIVVDDGSTDDTAALAQAAGARVVRHPVSLGNGAAVKSGARAATGEVCVQGHVDVVCLDAATGRLIELPAALVALGG